MTVSLPEWGGGGESCWTSRRLHKRVGIPATNSRTTPELRGKSALAIAFAGAAAALKKGVDRTRLRDVLSRLAEHSIAANFRNQVQFKQAA